MEEKRVMFSINQLKIMSAKHILGEAGIKSFTIDKSDSAHAGIFGDIELYVSRDDAMKARTILEKEDLI